MPYIAHGWPRLSETRQRSDASPSSSSPITFVRCASTTGRLLIVVTRNAVQAWHRGAPFALVGRYVSPPESTREEGEFLSAAWCLERKSLVVLTNKRCVYVFGFAPSRQQALPDDVLHDLGASSRGTPAVSIFVRVAFSTDGVCNPSSVVVDDRTILLGCAHGALAAYTWNGFHKGALSLVPPMPPPSNASAIPPPEPWALPTDSPSSIASLQHDPSMNALAVLVRSGICALYFLSEGDGLRVGVRAASATFSWVPLGKEEVATSAALSGVSRTLAVGTARGEALLFSVGVDGSYTKTKTLSLAEWGYTPDITGPVACLEWAADGKALAILWRDAGLSIMSPSGCKLMSHMGAHGRRPDSETSPHDKRVLCWGPEGLQLVTNFAADPSQMLTYSFARAYIQSEPVKRSLSSNALLSAPAAFLLADDRLLCIYGADVSGSTAQPVLQHLMLPPTYLTSNWPARTMSASKDGIDIAVSGDRGVVLYNMKQKRWRMFGDINQESQHKCHNLLWMNQMILMFASVCKGRAPYFEEDIAALQKNVELRIYPRYHLDASSMIARHRLHSIPLAVSARGEYIIVLSGTAGKLEVAIFQVRVTHDTKAMSSKDPKGLRRLEATILPIKELCIVTYRQIPTMASFLPAGMDSNDPGSAGGEPKSCIVLHMNGQLCLLDLVSGSEKEILDGVEHFWTDIDEDEPTRSLSFRSIGDSTSVDSPMDTKFLTTGVLWTYGCRGINILYTGEVLQAYHDDAGVGEGRDETLHFESNVPHNDPELEYDKEVYPLALFPDLNSIIGISQHISVLPRGVLHGFSPLPKSHPVLSSLVRYLLCQGAIHEASTLVGKAFNHPHFSHSLEWLLFTVLEKECSKTKRTEDATLSESERESCYNLGGVLDIIKTVPMYVDIVVRVARKIDPIHWELLFPSAGKPHALFHQAMQMKSYQTAAGFLVIIETVENPALSQECALDLLQETLQIGEYDLTGELVRFLLRSAKDMPSASQAWKGQSAGFFSYFTAAPQPSQAREDILKDGIQQFLSAHAAALVAGKKLLDLSVFMRKSGFDIVPLLREERYGVAKLSSFSEALCDMETALGFNETSRISNQADCELLLEAFRDAGLIEWVVVLATLLRRAPMLLNLFRGDNALWSIYSKNLKDTKYASLLDELEDGLAAHRFSNDI